MIDNILKGYRVLDLSQYLPGPYATRLLADLGAEVVKVEPPSGDPMRQFIYLDDDGLSPLYKQINAGKTVVHIDLKAKVGHDQFRAPNRDGRFAIAPLLGEQAHCRDNLAGAGIFDHGHIFMAQQGEFAFGPIPDEDADERIVFLLFVVGMEGQFDQLRVIGRRSPAQAQVFGQLAGKFERVHCQVLVEMVGKLKVGRFTFNRNKNSHGIFHAVAIHQDQRAVSLSDRGRETATQNKAGSGWGSVKNGLGCRAHWDASVSKQRQKCTAGKISGQ